MRDLSVGVSGVRRNVWIVLTGIIFLLLSNSAIAQSTRSTISSGNWSNKNIWDCNCVPALTDHVVIKAGHTVSLQGTGNAVNNLNIEVNAILNDNGKALTITGNLTVNGNYSGSGLVTLSGVGKTIDGTGSISNTNTWTVNGNKTILSTANLVKNIGNISINGAYTITNNGTI